MDFEGRGSFFQSPLPGRPCCTETQIGDARTELEAGPAHLKNSSVSFSLSGSPRTTSVEL